MLRHSWRGLPFAGHCKTSGTFAKATGGGRSRTDRRARARLTGASLGRPQKKEGANESLNDPGRDFLDRDCRVVRHSGKRLLAC